MLLVSRVKWYPTESAKAQAGNKAVPMSAATLSASGSFIIEPRVIIGANANGFRTSGRFLEPANLSRRRSSPSDAVRCKRCVSYNGHVSLPPVSSVGGQPDVLSTEDPS